MIRVTVQLRDGRSFEVDYWEPAPMQPCWYAVPAESYFDLSDADRLDIDHWVLHDLIERRRAWRLSLERRRA